MSGVACPTVFATAAGILLAASQPVERAGACPPRAVKSACVAVDNQTGDEILVYLDGAFAGRIHPRQSDRICVSPNRTINVIGRSVCDAWGPFAVRARPGESATVRFTEQGRQSASAGWVN